MKLGISEYKEQTNRVNRLAIPILLSFVTNFLFTIGDQAIIGRTSMTEFASVSLVSNILYALTGSIGIMALSLNIIGSKLLGQGKKNDYEALFVTAFSLTIMIGITFELLTTAFGQYILREIFSMSGDYLNHSYNYLKIAGVGLGLNMLLFVYSSYFKTTEKTNIIFKATIVSSIFNLLIDYVLVFGKWGFPKLGVMGAAIGTIVGLMINVIIYHIHFKQISFFHIRLRIFKTSITSIIKSYMPLLGQDLLESSLLAIGMMMLISGIGKQYVATYNLTNTLMQCLVLPIYAYSSALMTITAKAFGANDHALILTSKKVVSLILTLVSLVLGIVLVVLAYPLARVITNQSQLIEMVMAIIIYAIISQAFNAHHQMRRYMLNALSLETQVMNYTILISIVTLCLAFIFTNILDLKLIGIYMSLILSHLIYIIGFESVIEKNIKT